MDLETIQSMWAKDSQIDIIKVHEEAAKIPSLHAKYWDVYNSLKLLKEKALTQESNIKLDRYNYYTGKSDPEVYQAEPFGLKVRDKESLKRYMDADERIQTILLKIKYYDVMLTYLEDIVKQINNRSYQLKNIIDWQQLSG
jgi:hypothetical protein|tara:strand:+ start:360 stop:782 length:423 start_codon:yes stop_codon:yes gene_type:complete